MDEPFIISVSYQNKEYSFESQLFASSYSYRIEVVVNDSVFDFERDDSGNFRAVAASPEDNRIQKTDAGLLKAIAEKLEEILS